MTPRHPMSEADLQSAVLDMCTYLGLRAYHSTDSRRDTCAGFPDLVILGPHGVLWRELKTSKGRIRPEQESWLTGPIRTGHNAAVWRPEDLTSHRIQRELNSITNRRGTA